MRFLRAIRLEPEGQNTGFLQGKTRAGEKKVKSYGKGFILADNRGWNVNIRGYFGFGCPAFPPRRAAFSSFNERY
ncbi:MAG: hypothetical protein LBU85_07925 [Treponema sp.]|nr:hypothetical protein [Treponema sp.]